MRKKGISEALVRAVMRLYKCARTKVKAGTHLSEEFEVNVGVHHVSVSSPLLYSIVIDVVATEEEESTLRKHCLLIDLFLWRIPWWNRMRNS